MATKWNSTDRPAVAEDAPLKEGKPKGGRVKALAGFLAFFLGVSLTVSCLGSVGSRLVWERDITPRFVSGWQETDAFRQEVSSILRDLLVIGAGGNLYFYEYDYWTEHGELVEEAVIQAAEGGWPWADAASRVDRGTAFSESVPSVPDGQEPEREPDADFKADKNVLYWVQGQGKTYTNCDIPVSLSAFRQRTIDGYNFYVLFEDGRVSITKDGQELDVYGNGFYDGDSQWFVPGYENFPVSRQLDGVTVHMAVRETPIRYYAVDYKTGSSYNSSSMYYIAQQVEEGRTFYRTQAVMGGWGVAFLLLWFCLRKSTGSVNRKIASWTVYVWTEVRFVLVFLCGLWVFLPGLASTDFFWALRYDCAWDYGYSFPDIGSQLARLLLANIPALLAFIWLVWLIHNDHRHTPREDRRSLLRPFLRALRARELKRPIEKRLSRTAALLGLCTFLMGAELIAFLVIFSLLPYEPLPYWSLWTLFLLPVLLGAAAISLYQRRQWGLARDLGRLADQVEAVRAGDLSKPLILPGDADLRQTADSLNDIQAGMKAALEEQTRSERMKVELVSNVSHDLKTPLTSILSYAELLRQEDLPPEAADYARVINEKAHRLKGMVEDVFEVSKAAADQLPVHLEQLDLAKLLRQTLADMDGPIQESALAFKVELPEEPVQVRADGRRLYRVFQNLIDNALRYALEGSRVYLTLKTSGGSAETSVRNTSRNELPEGVDFTARFVRGDASRTDGGSGLGLSIAKSFTEACGGIFQVETVADLFTAIVTFPMDE